MKHTFFPFPLPPFFSLSLSLYVIHLASVYKAGLFSHPNSQLGRKETCMCIVYHAPFYFFSRQFTIKLNNNNTKLVCMFFFGCVCPYIDIIKWRVEYAKSERCSMRSRENYFKAMIHNFCHFDSIRKR